MDYSKETRNCKDYCIYRKCCYAKGEIGQDPFECPNAWRIEDHIEEARNEFYDPDEPEEEYEE